jgi:GH24 family phage-related lysozyme (muramidase)
MSREVRTDAARSLKELGFTGSGPFEAIVVSHLDPGSMGGLKVDLLRKNKAGSLPERIGTTIEVKYLSPFYGVTNYNTSTANDGYANSQKSYGMWFVPPDAGSKVLVTFAEGDISRGYWIGCIQDQFMNFMVPDGRASTNITTAGTPGKLKGKKLPTSEYNKRTESGESKDPTRFKKPYNQDFTESLITQGLLDDETRGTTSSSARREVPSSVFGISTPGPIDKRPGAPRGLYGEVTAKADVYVNRLGGSSFVMDDGDDKFIRKSPANIGPPEYANIEAGDLKGDRTIPHNEVMRFRTRTGHQILMHNSEDLIYIGNARGTSWIELTSNGKVDIYAQDSVSIHSAQDLNFTADRDVNLEAGRNISVRAQGRESGGNIQMESKMDTNILVEANMKVDVGNQQDVIVAQNRFLTVGGGLHNNVAASIFNLAGVNIENKAGTNLNMEANEINTKSVAALNIESGAVLNVLSGSNLNLNATGAVNVLGSGVVAIDGASVALNGGAAGPAGPAGPAQEAQEAGEITPLIIHLLSQVVPSDLSTITVKSITKRMPSHEPWLQHENLNPTGFTPTSTDITDPNPIVDAMQLSTPDTFRKNGATSIPRNSGSTVQGNTRVTDTLSLPPNSFTGEVPGDLIEFIKQKEGFRAAAYFDIQQYSNGYGTKALSSTEVITREVALARLKQDVATRRAVVVSYGTFRNYDWTSSQIDALTSFVYNLGTGILDSLTNEGTRTNEEIAQKITLYNKANGVPLAGLIARRNEEAAWFGEDIV